MQLIFYEPLKLKCQQNYKLNKNKVCIVKRFELFQINIKVYLFFESPITSNEEYICVKHNSNLNYNNGNIVYTII